MATVKRRVTFKMYLDASQEAAMDAQSELLRQLYNGALEERISAHRRGAKISLGDQEKSVTVIRRDIAEYAAIHTHACQITLKRLQRAYENFFRRVSEKADESGFPRFKSKLRWSGFGYKQHGNGFKITPKFDADGNWKHGVVRLSGIGDVVIRGQPRSMPQKICDCSIMRKADGWHLSVAFECEPRRATSDGECGLDWGVETFATTAFDDGEIWFEAVENDRFLADQSEALKVRQRALSKALRGKRSKRAAKARSFLARKSRKVANRRKNRNHQVTARLVAANRLIVTEELAVTAMTESGSGAAKAGLNRSILDASPGEFIKLLQYKAEEAGTVLVMLDPRQHRPSQTCPCCRKIKKKPLPVRVHSCDCGFIASRDQAAALFMLRIGRELIGQELAKAVALAAA
jgi:putative transposase